MGTSPTRRHITPIYVVIPCKNRLDLTRPLLHQLRDQGEYEEIFIFDNGSVSGVAQAVRKLGIGEVYDATGENIHQMWNRGLDLAATRAGGDEHYVAVLNNDLILGDDFLGGLARALDGDDQLAVVCPNYDKRKGIGVHLTNQICANDYSGNGGLAGFAFMLRGSWGYRFPEELNWWYGDNHMVASAYLCEPARTAGIVMDTSVKHIGGGSQTGNWMDRKPELIMDEAWWKRWVEEHRRPLP